MPKLARCIAALSLAGACAAVHAADYLDLPIANPYDHAFGADGVLYVTTDTQVHRYDTTTCTMLAPLTFGTRLRGIDVSSDGRWLAVADRSVAAGNAHVYVVDLEAGTTPVRIDYPAAPMEDGSYMVAWTENYALTISGSSSGSSSMPLRRYLPDSGLLYALGNVTQETMLAATGDGSRLAIAEARTTAGPVHLSWASNADPIASTYVDPWYAFEVATDETGSMLVVPTFSTTRIFAYDDKANALQQIGTIGEYAHWGAISAAIPPGGAQIVTADWDFQGSDQAGVKIYNAKTLQLRKVIDPYPFTWPGNFSLRAGRLTLSRDAYWLAVNLGTQVFGNATGVRLYDLAAEPIERLDELPGGGCSLARAAGSPHAGHAPLVVDTSGEAVVATSSGESR